MYVSHSIYGQCCLWWSFHIYGTLRVNISIFFLILLLLQQSFYYYNIIELCFYKWYNMYIVKGSSNKIKKYMIRVIQARNRRLVWINEYLCLDFKSDSVRQTLIADFPTKIVNIFLNTGRINTLQYILLYHLHMQNDFCNYFFVLLYRRLWGTRSTSFVELDKH